MRRSVKVPIRVSVVQAPGQGGSAALRGIVGHGSNIACQRPKSVHPLAHSHKGCIIGQCLHASIVYGHPCMQIDQTMSLQCWFSTYQMCKLMFLALTVTLPCIAWCAYAWQTCCCLPCTCVSMGPPAKVAWTAVVQDRQTHRETDIASKHLKLETGAFINFVSTQNSTTGSNKKKLLCGCATGDSQTAGCALLLAPSL